MCPGRWCRLLSQRERKLATMQQPFARNSESTEEQAVSRKTSTRRGRWYWLTCIVMPDPPPPSPTPPRHSRWRWFTCIFIVALPFLCCAAPYLIAVPVNNVRLNVFADPLFAYPLPPQTEVLRRTKEVGLFGNGNHCDYQAIQYMRTRLSQEEIEAYYQEVSVPRVFPVFEAKRQGDIDIFLFFHGITDGYLVFEAAIGDMGYSSGIASFDLRCN